MIMVAVQLVAQGVPILQDAVVDTTEKPTIDTFLAIDRK
jgi:hypothetical protein